CSYIEIERIEPELLGALFEAIAEARPDIVSISLERMAGSRAGHPNPLGSLHHQPSAKIALATDLTDGADGLVARTGGASKWKKHRRQVRKYSELGEIRLISASTPTQIDRFWVAFQDMKAQRFAAQG